MSRVGNAFWSSSRSLNVNLTILLMAPRWIPMNSSSVHAIGHLALWMVVAGKLTTGQHCRVLIFGVGGHSPDMTMAQAIRLGDITKRARPPVTFQLIRQFAQRNADHDPTHHVIEFKIPLRAGGVCVMASNTGLGHGQVGVDRLEISTPFKFGESNIRAVWLRDEGPKPFPLELGGRSILFVNRPQTDQPVPDLGPLFRNY